MAMKTGNQQNGEKPKDTPKDTSLEGVSRETNQEDFTMKQILLQMQEMQKANLAMQNEIKELKDKPTNTVAAPSAGLTPEMVEMIAKGIADARKHEKFDTNFDTGFVAESDIDPDDYLSEKEAVTFFAYSVFFCIAGDVRQGKQVRTPFGNVLKFRYEATKTKGTGRDKTTMPYCKYTSHSKKEVKWLMEHRGYGSLFQRNVASILSTDAQRLQKMAHLYNGVNDMLPHQIIARSKEKGLSINTDMDAMKMSLTMKMVEEQLSAEQLKAKKMSEDYGEAKVFLKMETA